MFFLFISYFLFACSFCIHFLYLFTKKLLLTLETLIPYSSFTLFDIFIFSFLSSTMSFTHGNIVFLWPRNFFLDYVVNPACQFEFSDELFYKVLCEPQEFEISLKTTNRSFPRLFFGSGDYIGTIGNARAFNLFNPDFNIIVSIICTSNSR